MNKAREAQGLHPANIALPRGAGGAPELPDFAKHYGFTGALVVEVGLVKGIGRYLDMEVIDVPEATGDINTDEIAMAKAVVDCAGAASLRALQPEEPGRRRPRFQCREVKIRTVEKLDRLLGYLLEHAGDNTYIAVTADHSTPVLVGDHTGEPVPIAVWGPHVRTDQVDGIRRAPLRARQYAAASAAKT